MNDSIPKTIYSPGMYLPPASFFHLLTEADNLLLESHEQFTRGTLRNRCEIAGPNGRQTLTIPIRKPYKLKPIKEVLIAYDEPWHRRHLHAIQTAYGSAPFFPHYGDLILEHFEDPGRKLWNFNLKLLETLLNICNLNVSVDQTDHYIGDKLTTAFIQDKFGNLDVFNPVSSTPGVTYQQVFTEKNGFLPNLSMIDLLFCHGPYWRDFI